ncbi:MAG: 4Fe-4S ferredoxin [Candidatus Baldrarchaeia archaeon]
MKLLQIWVKAPKLKGADLLIVGECVKEVNPEVFEEFSKGRVVLSACPEGENSLLYGKIGTIIRASRPRSITVLTVDGSPHCFLLHAAVNEAIFIVGNEIPRKHYVLVNGTELVEISPDAVRVARYLHLVNEIIKKNPEVLNALERCSLEYLHSRGKY